MSRVMRYDEGAAKRIVALSETPEMRAQRRRVIELLAPQEQWRVLDLGCGPGHLTRELAQAVGPHGSVCGVDVSEEMLAIAACDDVELVHVEGTTLPFEAGVFDAAVATQVYEFVEEIQGALAELLRVLRPRAKAVILDTDWDSVVWHSSDDARMRRVLDGWRKRIADPHLPRTLSRHLRSAGFEIDRREVFAIFDPCGRADSYSARQIEHLGASAVGVPDTQLNAWAADLRHLARTDDYFFSLNRYIFVATKPA
jgi:ubiquinone/menaquinone biosynthesis C-methylase UbiE